MTLIDKLQITCICVYAVIHVYGRFSEIPRGREIPLIVKQVKSKFECSKIYSSVFIIEGLSAKRAYIEFWPIFIFCRIEQIFGRLTCFDMKSIVP